MMQTESSGRLGLCFLLLTLVALCPKSVSASSWFVSPQIGTQGVSAQVGYRSDHDFSLRASWNQFGFDRSFKLDNVEYDADIHLKSLGLLFDYYPLDNGFHVTAGLYRNNNHISASGVLDRTFSHRIGNHVVQIDGKQLGKSSVRVDYAPVAPYLGIGYHNVTKEGFSFAADIGVLYQGNARVSAEPPEKLRNVNIQQVRDGVNQQKREIERMANKVRWYPVVSVGVAYTF
ncbi:hypothetical protein [Bordetella genomosp. 4]|uniref:Outer membrane protein beta-barrel domain-containing protein n=1 Tax=Bordetella genomosp. 4 TaxID=463044 RepID=A0A261TM58_9BORD|nr:hypothetical protein [Bordetella genomosp. 4]OZI42964.1 hypothetical protein CAL21_19305 [Bordetella genomosp. 4]OZI50525.1 hypothetical protein CAL20_21975 [Bordetella genomosp. 4]